MSPTEEKQTFDPSRAVAGVVKIDLVPAVPETLAVAPIDSRIYSIRGHTGTVMASRASVMMRGMLKMAHPQTRFTGKDRTTLRILGR